jgi:integrase
MTPEQFDRLYLALPSGTMKLLVKTDIESGLRWGELTELRPRDLDFGTGVLTVSRVVVETSPRFHPDGGWFLIKQYPKDQEHRRLRLGAGIVAKIKAHIDEHGLGDDDLLFAMPELPARPPVRALADPATLGLTRPNESGRRYRHGTLSAYAAGRCRCEHCRGAYASYRAQRRAAGRDQPRRPRVVQTDGHIPRGWFRLHIWLPAAEAAQLPTPARVHGLRHAHASWLLAGGADLQVVKERLGHSSIVTTQRYLGTLDETDDTAIDALSKIRNRGKKPGSPGRRRSA